MSEAKSLKELLESPMWQELSKMQQEAQKEYEEKVDEYWNSLDYEEQLKAFYAVCKRIYQGEVIDRGTYRYVLYEVFGFKPDAYVLGMDCGFMYLHNSIDRHIESNIND
jgi:hypothetical protein